MKVGRREWRERLEKSERKVEMREQVTKVLLFLLGAPEVDGWWDAEAADLGGGKDREARENCARLEEAGEARFY